MLKEDGDHGSALPGGGGYGAGEDRDQEDWNKVVTKKKKTEQFFFKGKKLEKKNRKTL